MVKVDLDQLDKILTRTVDMIEESKNQMFDIAENAKREYNQMEEDLRKLKSETKKVISNIDSYEKQFKQSKQELMKFSKNYDNYTQQEMKSAYERADRLRIDLAVEKEREQMLIQRRNELEIRLKMARETALKAESLINHVAVAMNYLTGDLKNLSRQLGDLQGKQLLGIKVLKSQEVERQRVAREIHDGPAQSMSNAVLKVEVCSKLLDRDIEKTRQELVVLKDLIRGSIQDVRRIIYDLRPMSLDDLGIIPTLERHILKVSEETGIFIRFTTQGSIRTLQSIIVVNLFRLVQEALNNINKHADAREVDVKLSFLEEYIELFIKDDGKGFNIDEVQKRNRDSASGFGLSSMRERTELLEGDFLIRSEPGKGTLCYIRIPLKINEVDCQ